MDKQSQIEALNRETEKHKKKQKERLRIDYDNAAEEYRKENPPIEIVFEGQVYEAPSSVTTEIMMFLIEHMDEGNELTDQEALKLLPMIFGNEISEAMKNSKAPFELISEKVLTPIMQYWGFEGAGSTETKKA